MMSYYCFHDTFLERLLVSDLFGLRLLVLAMVARYRFCRLLGPLGFATIAATTLTCLEKSRKGQTSKLEQRSHHHHSVSLCNVYKGQRFFTSPYLVLP
jgi:hypothetical protein